MTAPTNACAAEFDLDTLRGTLDEQGLAIAESQEASLKNRKRLAESTKGAPGRMHE